MSLLHTACLCDSVGSANQFCEPDMGTCECLPNVAGPDCSTCEQSFWGLSDGGGCVSCSCDEIGKLRQPRREHDCNNTVQPFCLFRFQ